MSITVTFNTAEHCTKFASCTNLISESESTTINIPWEKLSIAKADENAVSFVQDSDDLVEFILKGDLTTEGLEELITIKEDMGDGFYLVETTHGLIVNDLVDSLDPVTLTEFGLHEVSSLTSVTSGTPVVDPTSAEAQWARIRVASTYRPLKTSFSYYDSLVTKSVSEVYVVDSGINWEHPEFANVDGEDFWKVPSLNDFKDWQSHGTRVASCIAGENVGIAKNVKLYSVKIIEPGFMPTLLDLGNALNAILAQATANPNVTRIVNASWFVDENAWLESKFQALLDAGVTVVAAAGNTGIDIATTTPAGMIGSITVGSVDKYDIPSGFNSIAPSDSGLLTNYGLMLDIFAPGEEVVVAKADGTYAINSGTSYSAGYVSGAAAQIAALFENSVPNPLLLEKIIDVATKDALLFDSDNFSENQNRLIYLIGAEDTSKYLLDLYLGAFTTGTNEFVLPLSTVTDLQDFITLKPDESFVYSIEFEDEADSLLYSEFFSINQETRILTITKPTVDMPIDEILKMVRFKIISISDTVSLPSAWLFFFQVDESIDVDDLEYDITRALSESNSTSVFLSNFQPEILK
jgi:subtilisin family serine protease